MAKTQRILIVECMQEISSFNPLPSAYENFHIERGAEMRAQESLNTALGGALEVFAEAGAQPVLTIAARAGSGGLLAADSWIRLSKEVIDHVRAGLHDIDGIYVSLHGAMGAAGELDPEGYLLTRIREMAGRDMPIVISLDLHGILTDRMLKAVDGLAVYRTYPHVDFADTGQRAARLLLRLLAGGVRPVIARAVIPALVRGDELITKSGCYGELLGETRRLEDEGVALAAGVMIGNPFTDVPELCSQVIVVTDNDRAAARREAERIAGEFWPLRHRMQGKLISLGRAIAQARGIDGPVIFTDAADATSSGATGDSNIILKGLRAAGYGRRVLAQIVDPRAAAAAHQAGVGAQISIGLGGGLDPGRFSPMPVSARVRSLSDGRSRLETMRIALNAGPTAVVTSDFMTIVILSRTLSLFDRAMYYSNGLDPADFDLIIVKSPHTEFHMYDQWTRRNFNIDAAGATSANLPTLGHTVCARPMFPLDPDVDFTPSAVLYQRT